MTLIVPRTCTDITERDNRRNVGNFSQSLESYRSKTAYVLLGDPGAGKTTAFNKESENTEDGFYITARDFLKFYESEWHNKTLFIDGLDEVRAGKPDVRVPFDDISGRLNKLGNPKFRLSCREADWLGNNDLANLKKVSPEGNVSLLRLDPLNESDIKRVLESHPCIDDATRFILKSREFGIDGLLENPQSLNLMITAVASGGKWPRSRLETYESACKMLAKEHNDEHEIAADLLSFNPNHILDAAGRLCALMLISGGPGFRLRHHQRDTEALTPDQVVYERPEHLIAALFTKLFKADTEGRFVPVHRHIAEFLSARHMTSVIKNGLPVRRVIAHVAGGDGMIVSELRGLSAWLAALCEVARHDLINRDPIGIGLYGDISKFSVDDKTKLLDSMRFWFRDQDSMIRSEISTFAALATSDMDFKIREILTDSGRDREYQLLTEFILRLLTQGDREFDLSDTLCEIFRDETRWSGVRRWALNAFIRFETDEKGTDNLKTLLREIQVGKTEDHNRELLGTLLTRLYPKDLSPVEVWRYLSDKGTNLIGYYRVFWHDHIVENSSDTQIVELLDSLSAKIDELYPAFEFHNLFSLPIQLLSRGLKIRGDDIKPDRLYDWLGVACVGRNRRVITSERALEEVNLWLKQRPEAQKAVVLECLTRYAASDKYKHYTYNFRERLYNSELPADFGPWCLRIAEEMEHVNPRISDCLIEIAIRAYQNQNNNYGLTRLMLDDFSQNHESFRIRIDQLLAPLPIEEEFREEETKADREYLKREDEWIQKVRESETALRENHAEPALLFEIAQIYFDYSIDFGGGDGREKIQDRLRSDQILTDAAILGLIHTVNRSDVPEVDTVLDLYLRDHEHCLGWPYLAGLSIIEHQEPEDVVQWDKAKCQTALAFHYCSARSSYQPRWYLWLLHNKAELVSELLIKIIKADLQRAKDHIQQLHMLAYDGNHAQVARHASLSLLQAFPIRCHSDLIPSLEHLLCSAIRHADRTDFQQLIDNKLSRKSMNVSQRARWLAAGIVVSPGNYEAQLINFVRTGRGHKNRISNFADFLCTNEYTRSITEDLEIPTLKLLISVIGSIAGPDERPKNPDDRSATAAWFYTSAMYASDFVRGMIDRLSSIPTCEATDALETLQTDENLSKWHYSFKNKLANQRSIRRNQEYRHPNVDEICQTLNGGTPANAGDLAALVMDRLIELATTIRDGNTDDWRQYWDLPRGQPPTPRHEDHCRDALLSDLRLRLLPHGVDAQPEGQYAEDKRADIRVAFPNFQVPVEIKKNCHHELWSAMHRQLIKQYVRDPATDGYGIYLIFWFGEEYTQAPPEGKLPDSPLELQERLTAKLSQDEARKISICVIDVSAG